MPLVGVAFGAALAISNPPQNPIDYWTDICFLGAGFGVVGLLLGFLAWLCLRDRIPSIVAIAAIAIPFCVFGWFINGKGGRWDTAWWFGLIGVIAFAFFFARSFDSIANRDGDARGG